MKRKILAGLLVAMCVCMTACSNENVDEESEVISKVEESKDKDSVSDEKQNMRENSESCYWDYNYSELYEKKLTETGFYELVKEARQVDIDEGLYLATGYLTDVIAEDIKESVNEKTLITYSNLPTSFDYLPEVVSDPAMNFYYTLDTYNGIVKIYVDDYEVYPKGQKEFLKAPFENDYIKYTCLTSIFSDEISNNPDIAENYIALADCTWKMGDEESALEIIAYGYEKTGSFELIKALRKHDISVAQAMALMYASDCKLGDIKESVEEPEVITTKNLPSFYNEVPDVHGLKNAKYGYTIDTSNAEVEIYIGSYKVYPVSDETWDYINAPVE